MAPQAITFIVPGQAQPLEPGTTRGAGAASAPLPAGLPQGTLKQSVRVGAQRGGGSETRVTAVPGEDVVVLHIANGPELVLHPETARDLMLAQGEVKRSRGAKGDDEPAPGEVKVPVQLQWRGLEEDVSVSVRGTTRGFMGDVLLSAVDVVTGLVKDPAADFVASRVVERVDGQVEAGVYALRPDTLSKLKGGGALLAKVPAAPDRGPLLVFVHGTFSDTHGTFGKLWTQHPQRVRSLFNRYANRVYALDHPTLGVSPITNALTLVQALPKGARLHLVTHSRGGLVAEVLARVCGSPPLTAEELGLFAGEEYASQRNELKQLADLVRANDVHVDRIVRVACPARGTLLASKRLDAYVSVLKWSLQLAGIPVAPVLVDFLGEVARRRADPALLPGLAAQIPDSPLVRWLHAADEALPGQLRVVAGDMEGDSLTSWLKTLLADGFFWTDNDLVVQTRSMYGGAPRATGASFLLDQGGSVSHFSYFSNERTAEAIVNAITQDTPQGFRLIGPLSWAGESSTGVRARRPGGDDKPASEKPAVFVLPGILGSNLKVDGKRIWLGWRLVNGLKRLDYKAGQPDGVEPDGPIGLIYDDLIEFLSETHEVIELAYDWRRPIEDEARRLATAVDAALTAREKSGQPVRLLAHSMGGLVARTMQLERPQVWDRMMAHPGARLLMLGTPNGGSWAPMQVLSGDDTFGNTVVTFGAPFQDHAARKLLAGFPGFLQLQASLLDAPLGLARSETWQSLADQDLARVRDRSWWHSVKLQLDSHQWGVPPQDVLDRAVALRKRLDEQRDKSLGNFKDKLLLVVGRARFTPTGYEIGDEGLVYLDAPEEGDGRVTRQSALLPGVRTWHLDCEHGSLPDKEEAFAAYLELLERGNTNLLERVAEAAGTRGAAAEPPVALVRSRPSRTRVVSRPPESPREMFALDSRQPPSGPAAPGAALRITVVNGDLSFVRQPLLLGHYRSLRLTGTERVMNRLIGGTMEDSLQVGLYPEAPGSHQVFVNTRTDPDNPWQLPRPESVVVVGLGEEGKLKATALVQTVRQSVIAWAQRMAEKAAGAPALFELAATLIGSGGTGITPGQSAQLIAQGVREANQRLADNDWPRVSHLYLIELYLDRASDAWRALWVQAGATPGHYQVTEIVQIGAGALRRPLTSGYRGADYDFIRAETKERPFGDVAIEYTLDTKRARSEVTAQSTQSNLLRELVARASNDRNTDRQIGRTLFQLLVPVEMEPFFGGTSEMVIELDQGTAGIPWELLDSDVGGASDKRPWAIRCKLLRKLRTENFRAHVVDAQGDACVLVIGEPQCDPKLYPRLPGARAEANAVARQLKAPSALDPGKVSALISPDDPAQVGADARTVVNALLSCDWRIIHIAGHGEPPEGGDPRGVVLSNGTFLGPREIRNMRVVPELVFVNCCYLAARTTDQLLTQQGRPSFDRARFASGVAEELINLGVRCVIAAGWAVEDGPANVFATTFYESLLRGSRFIDAVAQARTAAQALGGNTWAAYQCYGDPDWYFQREGADAQRPSRPLSDELGGVASPPALVVALDTLAVESKFQKADNPEAQRAFFETQRTKIRYLEARFAASWGNMGAVAEAFGLACAAAEDTARAIEWYERALGANDGGASMKAAEQLGNLQARLAWEAVAKAQDKEDEAAMRPALVEARKKIKDALAGLERLVAVQPTAERESLCGSACKRLAMVEAEAGNARAEVRAIETMKAHYERAEALARASQDPDLFYPTLNRIAAELIVDAGTQGWKLDPAAVGEARQSLAAKTRDDPDFWSVVGLIELRTYEAIADRGLARLQSSIEDDYDDLHRRVSAPWLWRSVSDQARFVLSKYIKRASAVEKKAAKELLEKLESLAGSNAGDEPAVQSRRRKGRTAASGT